MAGFTRVLQLDIEDCLVGMSVCRELNLLAMADVKASVVRVFRMQWTHGQVAMSAVTVLGDRSSPSSVQFDMRCRVGGLSTSCLAFGGPSTARQLFVVDPGHDSVHAFDVGTWTHAGHVVKPKATRRPRLGGWNSDTWGLRFVAAHEHMVAVRNQNVTKGDGQTIRVYVAQAQGWTLFATLRHRVFDTLDYAGGMRFTPDGSAVFVAHQGGVVKWHVDKRSLPVEVCGVPWYMDYDSDDTDLDRSRLLEVGELNDVELDPANPNTVTVAETSSDGILLYTVVDALKDGPHATVVKDFPRGRQNDPCDDVSLAIVPGIGFVVLTFGQLQVFATADTIAMGSMSTARVAWLAAVQRGRRAHALHSSGNRAVKKTRA